LFTERNENREKEIEAAKRIFGLLPEDQRDEFMSLWLEFEAKETEEAKFAAALDRMEPLILNYLNQGHSWQKHGITAKQVFERNRAIQDVSQELWLYVNEIIEESVAKGYLKQ